MKNSSLPYIFLVLLLGATSVLCLWVQTPDYVSMTLVDRFVNKAPDGQQTIYYFVQTNHQDSVLIGRYATEMYHHEVPDSVHAQGAVEMVFYFFNEQHLESLPQQKMMTMSGGDPAQMARLRNLAVDPNGYFAVRFSELYRMFGRDSMYIVKGEVMVPHNGKQLKDFLLPTTPHE